MGKKDLLTELKRQDTLLNINLFADVLMIIAGFLTLVIGIGIIFLIFGFWGWCSHIKKKNTIKIELAKLT